MSDHMEGFPNYPPPFNWVPVMDAVARVGDMWTGNCCCHPPISCVGMSGVIITGSPNVLTNSIPTARKYDLTIGFCGHIGCIVCGSPTTLVNNRPMITVNDITGCCHPGIVITGSPDVKNDGCGG